MRRLDGYLKNIFRELRTRGVIKDRKNPTLELSLLPNEDLRTLKKDFLHKNVEVVDVLAFPAPHQKDFPNPQQQSSTTPSPASLSTSRSKTAVRYLGEIYINEDIARDDHEHTVFLLVHGILHLLGYRHEKKHDSIIMERLENELMKTPFLYHGIRIRTGT